MNLTLRIWRQNDANTPGKFVEYPAKDVSSDMSFLEIVDVLNEDLTSRSEEPVAFEHDCREGICGSCGFLINGVPHGPRRGTTVCQLHMRFFKDGDYLTIEPWRARAFPIVKDLVVDRSAFDRIIQAGGYISAPTGSAAKRQPSWSPRRPRTQHSPPPHALVVEAAWRPAPIARPCCSPRPKSSISMRSHRANPSVMSERWTWWQPWRASISAAAPITVSVRQSVRNKFRSSSSPVSTAT